MATLLDGQVGLKKETTYGTPVVVDRFHEALADSTHNFTPEVYQGMGLRVGSVHRRTARRGAGVPKGEVTIVAELASKGFGVLLESICGSIASTLVSGTTYQIRGLSDFTTTVRPSYTIQFGVPRSDASGTVDPYTYEGCVATSFEIDAPERGVPTLSVTFWAENMLTATALASFSPPSSPTIFASQTGKAGATLGGTLTVPSATALESGGTAVTNVRSWRLSGDLLINERPQIGGWQRPTAGGIASTLTVVQDYDATTMRDLQASQGVTSFTGWYEGAALSTGNERFGVVIPAMQLDDGALGQITAGEGSIPELSFSVGDNLTDEPWYIVVRTSDNAL